MIEVSREALGKLGELLAAEGGEQSAIRIAVMGGGPQGPGLGLVVDEVGGDDTVVTIDGLPLTIDRRLIDYCRAIRIDFTTGSDGRCGGASGSGFIITPEVPINF